jgi:hypothetical protein
LATLRSTLSGSSSLPYPSVDYHALATNTDIM